MSIEVGDNSQSNIGLGKGGSKVKRPTLLLSQVLLRAVERLEKRHHVALIRLAGSRKACLVNAVVDAVIGPGVGLLNLLLELLGVQLDSSVLFLDEVVKL